MVTIISLYTVSSNSSQTSPKRRSTPTTTHNIQQWTDTAIGSRISSKRVHIARQTFWIGRKFTTVRNANQNLVSKPTSEGQTHRKGSDWSTVQVGVVFICIRYYGFSVIYHSKSKRKFFWAQCEKTVSNLVIIGIIRLFS